MRRIGWYAVSAAVTAIILGGALMLVANLYVQSQAVQQRIRQALTTTLRLPVTIRKTTVSPWEGLRIDGITVRPNSSTAIVDGEPDFLRAESFRVQFALWPLLHRQLVVNLLWLDKPQLAWAQNLDGNWQYPPGADAGGRRKKAGAAPAASGPEPSPANAPPASAPPVMTATTPVPTATPGAARHPTDFTVALDKFRLRHGNLDFLNFKHRPVGKFEEVNLDGRLSDAQHATGLITCDRASMTHPNLALTKCSTRFAYDQADGLTLGDGHAVFAGGTIRANGHVDLKGPDGPFAGECRLEKVDLKQLLDQAANHLQLLDGSLQGKVVASGLTGHAEGRVATARLELIDARLKDFPLLQTLGEITHISDLNHLEFKVAQLDCRLDGAVLEVDPLLLISHDLKITIQGKYRTDDDRLDLHGRLVIDDAVSRQLPDFVGDQFKPCDDEAPGSRYADFDVTGPLNNPKSNLYSRLLGEPVKGLLNGLLSPKVKVPKDKGAKHHADTATPTASATP